MNTESKEYKKIGVPLFKAGDKVKTTVTQDGVLTIKGEPRFNGFTWMYQFEGNDYGFGQEYLRSAFEFVAYNDIGNSNTPTKWVLFTGYHLAQAYVETKNEEWDFTDIKTFKCWYPEIDLV